MLDILLFSVASWEGESEDRALVEGYDGSVSTAMANENKPNDRQSIDDIWFHCIAAYRRCVFEILPRRSNGKPERVRRPQAGLLKSY